MSRDRERRVWPFFFLTFVVTWAAWGLASRLAPASLLRQPFILLGVFAPSLVALAIALRARGSAGARDLLAPIGRWRVGVRWYVFAVTFMSATKLLVALMHRVTTGVWPQFGATPWWIMLLAIPISTWVQAGEEIGWRGHALPRLTRRFGLAPASIVLGVIWAAWHLPLFYMSGGDTFGQSFPVYTAQVTALSVAMAWLFWRTGGSLLLTMLMHAAINNTKDIVPSGVAGATNPLALSASPSAWLTVGVLWVAAAYFLVRMRDHSASDRSA
jgi:uncharacterized protein